MNKFKITAWILGVALIAFVGCKKEFDAPPGHELSEGQILTIDSLINMFNQDGEVTFTEDMSVFGIVTADELTGNFYHEFYFQDENTGTALHVNLVNPGGVTEGDKVRINLNGATLTSMNELLTLDEVDVDKNVFIQENLVNVEPTTITLDNLEGNISKLVRIEGVQLVSEEMCETFANGQADPPVSFNRTLMDCNGNEIILRNSGYSNFADEIMASGNGTFVGILSKYNADWQLKVRRPSDMDLNGDRCGGEPTQDCTAATFLDKDFNDLDINSGGWTTQVVVGTLDWHTGEYNGDQFGTMSNYNGSNNLAEAWLISPAVDLSVTSSASLNFKTIVGYSGDPIEVLVSTDYSSGNPNDATWTTLSAELAPITGSWTPTWVNSGSIDLTDYLSSTTRVAFKYIGAADEGCTWEIDDIIITE